MEEKLQSIELAELIVDALLRAGLVAEESISKAVTIAAEEIESRKVVGDY